VKAENSPLQIIMNTT